MRRFPFACCVASLLVATACSRTADQGAAPGGAGRGRGGRGSVTVETTKVAELTVKRTVDLSGTLISLDQARVSSEVAGVVAAVPVELGAQVRTGDVLVRVAPRELQIALDRAESALRQVEAQLGMPASERGAAPPEDKIASVRQAQANRDDAKAAFDRANQLNTRGLVSQVDKDTAETRLKVMDANYQAALDSARALSATLQDRRAAYELAQKKLNDATIRSPISGAVSDRLVQPGEFIKEDTPVVTVVQMNPLKLRTGIQEKYAGMIHEGQPVDFRVEAFPERGFAGKIAFVSPSVDQTTRTFAVEVLVENSDLVLKPGFFAKGSVVLRTDEHVMAVPDDAVSTLAGVSTVYVVAEGKAKQQIVTLGVHQGTLWEVVQGLTGSEVLAASQLNQLATGMGVSVGDGRGRGRGGASGRGEAPDGAPGGAQAGGGAGASGGAKGAGASSGETRGRE